MILMVRGGDELGIRRRLQRLKDEADGGSGMLATNLSQIAGRDATASDILGPAMTPPFLAPRRLVIVEGFLDRWDGRGQAQREDGKEPAQPRTLGPFEVMLTALEGGVPESTILVFTGGDLAQSNAMAARLKKLGATEEVFREPQKDELLRFVRDEGAARGVRFRASKATGEHWESGEWLRRPEADPVALLAGITNGSTLAISQELDKLALYTMGREVTVDDVYTLCSGDREVTQFNLLDAIQDGKAADALHHLDRLMEKEDVTQYVLTMLTTRYRQTAVVAELMEAGATEDEVGRAMGNPGKYPGLRQAGMRRARRVGSDGARAALAAIAETDSRGKKNEIRHDVGLEMLVTKLARLGH